MGKHILKLLAMFMIVGLVSCTKSAEDDDEDDDDWGGGGVGTTSSFIFQGTTYSGVAQGISATSGGSGKDVVIASTSHPGKGFTFYNVPSASSGSFAIKDAYSSVTTPTNIWGIMQIGTTSAPMAYYTISSGSITKTGANSFTFTTQVSTNITASSGTTVTGTASY